MISQTQIIVGVMIAMITETSVRKDSHLKPQAELGSKAKLIICHPKTGHRWSGKKPITSMATRSHKRTETKLVNRRANLAVQMFSPDMNLLGKLSFAFVEPPEDDVLDPQ